jgi:hypothetical protein
MKENVPGRGAIMSFCEQYRTLHQAAALPCAKPSSTTPPGSFLGPQSKTV